MEKRKKKLRGSSYLKTFAQNSQVKLVRKGFQKVSKNRKSEALLFLPIKNLATIESELILETKLFGLDNFFNSFCLESK